MGVVILPVLVWVQTSRVKLLPPFEAEIALHTWYGVQPVSTRRPGCVLLGAWEAEGSVGVWAWGDFDQDSAETLRDCVRG